MYSLRTEISLLRTIKRVIRVLIAQAVAYVIPPRLFIDNRYFRLWQSRGYHITPVHFYQPIPDTRSLTDDIWTKPSELVGVDMNVARQLEILSMLCANYKSEYEELTPGKEAIGGLDWAVLYYMVRHFKPRRIIEIGSGTSTRVSAMAIERNRQEACIEASLVAIEPYPRQELIDGFAGLSELKRMPVQNVPLAEFEGLEENDILFIDSSHMLKIGSDVKYEILEIIPRLRKGVVVHIHDVFFPYEYPRYFGMELSIFWNEAYILQAFLAFNPAFEVFWSGSYLHHYHTSSLQKAYSWYDPKVHQPSSLWMRRIR